MTIEELKALLSHLLETGRKESTIATDTLVNLTSRAIAAENLVVDAEAVMHGLIINNSWSSHEVNKLLYEITAFREASK